MTRLLVCAPLRVEARAVRRGVGAGFVVRTGMGPVRSARTVARMAGGPPKGGSAQAVARMAGGPPKGGSLRGWASVRAWWGCPGAVPPSAGPVAITGVCGALDPSMRPGDLVVATELRYGTSTIGCPSAEPLAAELRRTGLTVHTGPIVTVDRPAVGARRAALAGTGASAVDMESAVLAGLLPGRPLAVVRAVADTPDRALFGPSIVPGGLAALGALRRIGPALATWAAACGPREALPARLDPADQDRAGSLTQTTPSATEAAAIVAAIKERLPAAHGPGPARRAWRAWRARRARPVDVIEHVETVHFTLPKGVRR